MVNKLKRLPSQFRDILKVASNQAVSLGVKIYLVGGVVRDLLLNKATFDLDIVVEGDATRLAQEVAGYFRKQFRRHHAFGTAAVYFDEHKIDFATARSENYPHWGALPKVTPDELTRDLFRRDFTINAMAIGLNKDDYGKLIDFYGGAEDLKEGLIRVLHEKSFLDDPTRILRAVRFEQRFGFKLENGTNKLMRGALDGEALTFVHPHRLSDELTLILKEKFPYRYIKRLYKLTGFSFLGETVKFTRADFLLFKRIEQSLRVYKKIVPRTVKVDEWVVYLGGILINLPQEEILSFFRRFGLRKKEMIKVITMKENLFKVRELARKRKPHIIYQRLNALSYETIIFFYAYYSQKKIRKNLELFLKKLRHIRLKVRGKDLRKLGIDPLDLYSGILRELLYAKIDKKMSGKKEELREAEMIFNRLSKIKQLPKPAL